MNTILFRLFKKPATRLVNEFVFWQSPLKIGQQIRRQQIGFIRFYCSSSEENNVIKQQQEIGRIPRRLAIIFTCKVCSTRQGPKQFSKTAYEQGIVLIRCEKCLNHHLIADNLGWFAHLDGKKNIEDILAEKGEMIKRGNMLEIMEEEEEKGQKDTEVFQIMGSNTQTIYLSTEREWTTIGQAEQPDRENIGGMGDPMHNNIDISSFQRVALGFGSAFMSLLDPKRGDMIATMGETTVPHSLLSHIRDRMRKDVSGAELLRKRPRINSQTVDRHWLQSLSDGTLGREYSRFLEVLNTSPDARPPVQFVDEDPELLYVMQRYRETHDFTHVILQMRPNMLGEVTVKYFEAIQLGFPMCITAAIFGALRLGPNHRRQLIEHNIPWVIEQAEKGRFLLALDWEYRFEQTIADLQAECSIQPFTLPPY